MADEKPRGLPEDKKASIIIKKKGGDVTLTCHFNPSDYAISRSISWNVKKVLGQDQPTFEYTGADANKLSLKLLFDTTLDHTEKKDVREYTKLLWEAAYLDKDNKNATTNNSEPPHVVFMWGKTWSFEAVITSISQDFVLFDENGIPLRSNVSLSLTQVKDDRTFGKQNPTSGGVPGQIHHVQEGDRLDLLAAKYYNKPTRWREIAQFNKIDNPRRLRAGQRLIIPD